jgi:hypothetical protein
MLAVSMDPDKGLRRKLGSSERFVASEEDACDCAAA